MIEFYTWPTNVRLLITFFFAVCVLFQTGNFVLSRYRFPKNRVYLYESILELAILGHILCLSLLYGQVYMGFDAANAAPTDYATLRIITFIWLSVSACLVSLKSRQIWPLLTILPALAALPAAEIGLGQSYPFVYLLFLLLLLARSILLCFKRCREIKTGLSVLSVKNAIDNLPTGILFSREDGRVLLISSRMQQLTSQIAGKVCRDGNLFYRQLTGGAYDDTCQRSELDNQIVCLLPDHSAWMFTRADLEIQNKTYIQLTASDVTEHYRLTAELKTQDEALKAHSEEIKQTIAGLQTLSWEREAQKAKMRAHDVLGQQLTLLLRMVRGDQELDVELLKSMSQGLLRALRVGPATPSPDEELANLRQIFTSIGVEIKFTGELPKDETRARLLIDIIRESVVNAVRHGFATEVQINSFAEDTIWRLQIQNNGHPPAQPILEGGGIGGMREKLTPSGGTLQVTQKPQFSLTITLPEGAL